MSSTRTILNHVRNGMLLCAAPGFAVSAYYSATVDGNAGYPPSTAELNFLYGCAGLAVGALGGLGSGLYKVWSGKNKA